MAWFDLWAGATVLLMLYVWKIERDFAKKYNPQHKDTIMSRKARRNARKAMRKTTGTPQAVMPSRPCAKCGVESKYLVCVPCIRKAA